MNNQDSAATLPTLYVCTVMGCDCKYLFQKSLLRHMKLKHSQQLKDLSDRQSPTTSIVDVPHVSNALQHDGDSGELL